MGAMSTSLIASLGSLLFQNQNIANLGDATGVRGSTTAGSAYFALHSADPGVGGAQNASEVSYTTYARVAVPRTTSDFTVSGGLIKNTNAVLFPQCTAGSDNARFWSVGLASSGASVVLFRGPMSSIQGLFSATTADTLTLPGHTLSVNDQVIAVSQVGGTLPTGVTEGTTYFVKTVSGNDITLSATLGGAQLDITGAGTGLLFKASPLAISANITPQIAALAAVIQLG